MPRSRSIPLAASQNHFAVTQNLPAAPKDRLAGTQDPSATPTYRLAITQDHSAAPTGRLAVTQDYPSWPKVSQTRLQSGQPVTSANFREDINVNGAINGTDVSGVKLHVGSGLP